MEQQNIKNLESNVIKNECVDIERLIDNLTLFDDDLMSRVFERNVKATELVLGIILRKTIRVVSVVGQDELKSPLVGGRNITIDVHALTEDGEEIDVEVQGDSGGSHVRRARFHSSMMDVRMMEANQKFQKMRDSYVIFIYKRDKFKQGLPIYHIERTISETGEVLGDGSHIIYVNGSYRGDDEIGRLIADFYQPDANKIHYRELSEGVRHFKEERGGREDMGEAVQKFAQEYAKKYAREYAQKREASAVRNLMENMTITLEQALNAMGIQGEDRIAIERQLQK